MCQRMTDEATKPPAARRSLRKGVISQGDLSSPTHSSHSVLVIKYAQRHNGPQEGSTKIKKLQKTEDGDEKVGASVEVKRTTRSLSGRMDGRSRRMIVFFLLFVFAGTSAEGQAVLDVCSTCHANATCEDKSDGSGKVCNCKYGFVGNGRNFCQDKDECQIGSRSSKICGQHTMCHNTHGSYYCTCLNGYKPSNNMAVFIPNDGTHCQDIDECKIAGLCGDGGLCRNLDGSFDCSCQVGYRVHDGVEPFQPATGSASCKVVDCGQPALVEDMVLLLLTGTTYGSMASFFCEEGFVWRRGDNTSVCGADGLWRGLTMVCEAKCGPVPILANSEVVWHNRSVVIHRCVAGYHSWRGSNVSVCGSSGEWQKSTLRCIEIKPPINHLFIFNEKCLSWKAEKYDEDTEIYKVTYIGSRDYQRSFHDKNRQILSSTADQVELCLNLLPVTNYTITITATTVRFTATITTNTSLPAPPAPVVYYREFETHLPTLKLHRSPYTLDPISSYQVFVLPVEGTETFDCSSPVSSDPANKIKSPVEYITAQIDVQHVGTEMNFTVGDGFLYGGFYNAPLKRGKNYYIILRAISQWKTDLKSSCVVWAKVGDTSYVLRVSALSVATTIGLVAMVILVGYHCTWFIKKT